MSRKEPNTVCSCCGTPMYIKPSALKKAKTHTCSRECHIDMCKKRMTGKNNHQYGLRGHLNASFKGDILQKKNNRQIDTVVYMPHHPFANKSGRVKIHRLLVEANHERYRHEYFIEIDGSYYLKKHLVVHHIDGNHYNNDISNLDVMTVAEHRRVHNMMRPQKKHEKTGRFVSSKLRIKFRKLKPNAKKPYQATRGSAGFDLYSTDVERTLLTEKHNLGIAVQIPEGYVGLLFPRSSCAKTGKWMGNSVGVIDSDYVGELSAVFYTREGAESYEVGDRVAQLLVIPTPHIEWKEVDELTPTERGSGGYGSTGR